MNLPRDIKSYARGNILKRLGKWFFFTVLTILAIIIFNESFSKADVSVRAFVYTVVLLIPFVVMKIPQLIFDSSWHGVIEKIHTVDGVGSTSKAIPRYETAMRVAEVTAEVKTSDGRTKTVVLYSGRFDNNVNKTLNTYQVGDRVVHIRGLKHSQIITANGASCAICGHFNKGARRTCAECGYTLNALKF